MKTPASKPALKQRARVWLLFLLFLGLWSGLKQANRPEPEYADQPLWYWLERLSDPGSAMQASQVLSEMGPEALPALMDALDSRHSKIESFIYSATVRMHLAPPRRYDAPSVRATAAYLLGQMGVAASAATGDLVKALDDDDVFVRFRASRALAQIGTPALPDLMAAITNSPSPGVRKLSVETLARMGPRAKRIVPALNSLQETSQTLTNEIHAALKAIER